VLLLLYIKQGDFDLRIYHNYLSQTNGPSDAYSIISQQDRERAEPEQIKIWREQQTQRLEEKGINPVVYE